MTLRLLAHHFTICQIADQSSIDWNAPFCFAAKTDVECSLVFPDEHIPADALVKENGWRAFRIEGVLEFSLVGILAKIAAHLAECQIPIFAVSTYNTDYVLLKEEKLPVALTALENAGYSIVK